MSLRFNSVGMRYPSPGESDEYMIALDSFNLVVEQGHSVAIIGPSGCGKSSALRLASGLMRPTSGTVLIDGEVVLGPRRSTALVLQDFGLLDWKTVYQNAELGLRIHKVEKSQRKIRTVEALNSVGLSGFERCYPNELSGGMQQRLALARAIALDIDTLLLDEPLSALDALLREELQNQLLELWLERKYTQVLVTHSIEEAVFLGQRIIVMAQRPGRVIAEIENPMMGEMGFRSSEVFFEKCREVRETLYGGGHR